MSAFVQSSTTVQFTADATSKNLSLTVGAGNSVLVCVGLTVFEATEPTITVSDGASYTEDVAVWLSSGVEKKKIAIHRLHNSSGGAKTINVSFTGPAAANVYGAMAAHEVSGLDNLSPDKTMSGSGASLTPATSASGALTQSANFVIGAVMTQWAGIDLPSGFTNLYLDDLTSGVPPNSHDYKTTASTSSVTIDWGTLDVDGGNWVAVGAVYRDTVSVPQWFQYNWPHQLHARL